MVAAQMGHMEVLEVLFRYGADPNAEGDHGMRPLHRAAMAGHEAVARRLLKQGADPLAIDSFLGEGAVHHAAREGHEDVLRCASLSPRAALREHSRGGARRARARARSAFPARPRAPFVKLLIARAAERARAAGR